MRWSSFFQYMCPSYQEARIFQSASIDIRDQTDKTTQHNLPLTKDNGDHTLLHTHYNLDNVLHPVVDRHYIDHNTSILFRHWHLLLVHHCTHFFSFYLISLLLDHCMIRLLMTQSQQYKIEDTLLLIVFQCCDMPWAQSRQLHLSTDQGNR